MALQERVNPAICTADHPWVSNRMLPTLTSNVRFDYTTINLLSTQEALHGGKSDLIRQAAEDWTSVRNYMRVLTYDREGIHQTARQRTELFQQLMAASASEPDASTRTLDDWSEKQLQMIQIATDNQ